MENPLKTVITSRLSGDVVVFEIEGELSRSTCPIPTLSELVKAQLRSGRRKILLNFAMCGFVDSFGVGEMIASLTSTQNVAGRLKLCSLPGRVLLVFKITGLDKIFDIYETEEAALESFAKPPAPEPEA